MCSITPKYLLPNGRMRASSNIASILHSTIIGDSVAKAPTLDGISEQCVLVRSMRGVYIWDVGRRTLVTRFNKGEVEGEIMGFRDGV